MIEDSKQVYSRPQRALHWLTVLLVIITVPVAFAMNGAFGQVSDAVGGFLYDSHKLIGFVIFFVVVARLILRATRGAPPEEPTLNALQRFIAGVTHWMMYALLILHPVIGYIALQYYGEIRLFGVLPLPTFSETDQKLSDQLFSAHKVAAFVLIALVLLHFAAAMFHRFILRDNVLGRMWPSQLQKK